MLLDAIGKAVSRAQCRAVHRRLLDSHGAWMPWLADISITFEGTSHRVGEVLHVVPGRPRFARITPWRVRRFEVCCVAGEGWVPRLYVDGHAVDTTGMTPHP